MDTPNHAVATSQVAAHDNFGLEIADHAAEKWAKILLSVTLALLVLGSIAGAIIWFTASGDRGWDIAALTWTLTFGGSIVLMAIRQMLLAERI